MRFSGASRQQDGSNVREAEGSERERVRYAWRLLSVVCLASLMSGINVSSLNIALPAIVAGLDAGPVGASWILLSFQLTHVTLLIFFGRLADVFGRRTMYLTGVGLFTAASLLAGAAPDVGLLIACRVLQAAGAAMLMTNSAALVTAAFPRRMLGQGLGIYMASFSLAQMLGPTVGGLVTTEWGWRWTLLLNVPIGIVCLLWGLRVMERVPRSGEPLRLDPAGNLLVVLGLGGLLVALSQGGSGDWLHPLVVAGAIAFLVAVPVFLLVEKRVAAPVVDVRLFSEPVVGIGVLAGFLGTMSRFAVVLLMGLYFQAVQGDTPSEAGLKVLPIAIASIVSAPGAGLVLRWVRARTVAVVASTVSLAGLVLLLAVIDVDTPYPLLITAVVVIGLGSGAFVPANSTAMLQDVRPDRLGITNAVRLMAQSCGVTISTALSLMLIGLPLPPDLRAHVLEGSLSRVSPDALDGLITGFRWTFGLMAVMSVLCVLASLVGRQAGRGVPGPRAAVTDLEE
ncbi:EmrB/QacA subfamily drug resistance transporter [Pseudonocardia kunmingensis]|uniref:EmrB/QacA subfamily drug resistance transporter n=1 Tax=Pseudonocardia kunmingensis TaxID=630975 RepID=A0A543E003_9PSEU|nr:EmrB/QacA subfamily drug resistance transporter [Pseudonocardia kunmingensis]